MKMAPSGWSKAERSTKTALSEKGGVRGKGKEKKKRRKGARQRDPAEDGACQLQHKDGTCGKGRKKLDGACWP